MADDGMRMTGDWRAALNRLARIPERLQRNLERATAQNAVGLEGEIRKGMIAQAPGGVPYQPLSAATIALRLAVFTASYRKKVDRRGAVLAAGGGVAHKALINHGDLLGSITHHIRSDRISAAVGVSRKAKTKDGKPVIDIARVVFYGKIIPVTPQMRAWLHGQGIHLRKDTTAIVIPPRPTIEPAYLAYKPTILGRYQRAAIEAVRSR